MSAVAAATPAHALVTFGSVTLTLSQGAGATATGSLGRTSNGFDDRQIAGLPTMPVVLTASASTSDTSGTSTYSAAANGSAELTFSGAGAGKLRSIATYYVTGVGSGDAYANGGIGLEYRFTTTTSEALLSTICCPPPRWDAAATRSRSRTLPLEPSFKGRRCMAPIPRVR